MVIGTGAGRREQTLLRGAGHLAPPQARSFVCLPFQVPTGTGSLEIRFSFQPALVGDFRNLLTLSLFDPWRFRGAGHRHAPDQEIHLGPHYTSPGFVPGPLEPGEWLLEIDCHAVLQSESDGLEYNLEVLGLTGLPTLPEMGQPAPEAAAGAQSPFSQVAAATWLKGDLHVHSHHSDGRWTAEDIARYVEASCLDFLAVTDHNTTSAFAEVEGAVRAAGLHTLLIPAMELTTFYGHANALGVSDWIDWRVHGPGGRTATIGDGPNAPTTRTMRAAAAEVHRLGGTFVINHPRSRGYPGCTGCRWEFGDASAGYADAVEVWNGVWERAQNAQALVLWNRWLASGRRLPAVAGTDAHRFPTCPDQLGFTYVWAVPAVSAILAAIRGGRSYLSCGPTLVWRRPPLGQGVPAAGELVVDVDRICEPADLCLVRNAETVARRPIAGAGPVALELPPDGDGSTWYRLELYRSGTSDLLAVTNPAYVV